MTVEELIESLKALDPNMIVLLQDWSEDYMPPSPLGTITVKDEGVVLGVFWG